jgi:PAS domain S-box-containing protein
LRPVVALPLGAFLALAAVMAVTLVVLTRRRDRGLRASEALTREALDAAPDAMVGVDAAGRIVLTNTAAVSLFGFSREELLGLPVETLIPKALAERHAAHRAGFFANPTARPMGLDLDLAAVRKDGTAFPVDISLSDMRTGDGRIAFAAIRDVTQRKRAEAELLRSEDRYRDLVEHSQDLICTHDLDGLLLSINPHAARMLGYEPAELLGKNVRDALAPQVRHEFDQYLAAVRTEGAAQGLMLMRTRSGEERIWEYRNTLRTEGVAAPVVRGMASDITERWRAAEALRQAEARLRTLADVTFAVIWRMDARGQRVGDNASWRAFTGQTEAEIRDGRWARAVHPDDLERVRIVASQAMAEGTPFRVEERMRRHDGEWRDMVVRAAPLRDTAGAIIEWVGAAVDVTERVQAEAALHANEQRLRVVLRGLNMAVFHQDLALRYTWMFHPQLGYAVKDVVGHTDAELLPPEAARRVTEIKRQVLETGERAHEEVSVTVEGATFVYDLSAEPLRDAGGAVIGLTGATLDISELKRVEAANRLSQERMQAQFRDIPFPVYAWTRRDGDFVLTDFNAAAATSTEGRIASLVGTRASVCYADRPDVLSDMALCLDRRTTIRREMRYRFRTVDAERDLSVTYACVPPEIVLVHVDDVTDRKQTQAMLEESQRELRALAAHLEAVREDERSALARNVHDDLGQALTALKMDVRTLRRRVARGGRISKASLAALDELVDSLVAAGRHVVSALRPTAMEGLGLRESIELQAAELLRSTGIRCEVALTPDTLLVDDHMAMVLYRIVQESLTNVARHAAATAVTIRVRAAGEDLVLRVEDNGRGMAAERPAGRRFGIIGMRERVLAVGGRFEIRGGVHGGTAVEVVVPLRGREAMEGPA